MKQFLFICFLSFNLFGVEYEIFKSEQKIGDIKNIETVDKGYLVTETTELTSVLTGFNKNIVFYTNNKPFVKESTKYVEDKQGLISMIKSLKAIDPKNSNIIENDKYLFNIKCKNESCTYRGLYKETIKTLSGKIKFSKGLFSELSNNELNVLIKRKI